MTSRRSSQGSERAGTTVVLGVTGGIAACKSAHLVRLLAQRHETRVVMTEAARRFVAPLTFEAVTGRDVLTDLFAGGGRESIAHVRLAEEASLVVVAPATADFIARAAAGRADDLLGALVLASRCPVLLAPGMNTAMWENPLTQENLARLRRLGRFRVVGPEVGPLACGWEGVGRMSEPDEVFLWAEETLRGGAPLDGLRVVVTAGPTREEIDPVRYLSNHSSGRMGYALARGAAARGAAVTLVAGPVALAPPSGVEAVPVVSAADMRREVLERVGRCDLLFMAAAVADWRPAAPSRAKLKKEAGGAPPALALEETCDILREAAASREGGRPVVVGFCLETDARTLARSAREKLARKGCDLIAANLAAASLGGERTTVTLIGKRGAPARLVDVAKEEAATRIIDAAAALLPGR